VFTEPQFPSRLVPVLIEDTDARSAVLDPLGTGIPPGPDAYFQLMDQLAGALLECLLEP
jgi:zinc transport system substrate-binding protein